MAVGDLVAVRYENWKIVFMEQRAQGTLQVWAEPAAGLVHDRSGNGEAEARIQQVSANRQ